MAFLRCHRPFDSCRAQQQWRFLLLWLGLACLYPAIALAQSQAPSEYHIKAIFLYKFCLYVEWPPGTFENAYSPLTIGVVDADEVANELEALANNRTLDGRPFTIRRIDNHSNLDGVQMLFIARSQQDHLERWIALARGHSLLVVTETPNGLDAGSSINFLLQDNRVRFDIDITSAQKQGLKLGAQLLQVARSVQGGATQ